MTSGSEPVLKIALSYGAGIQTTALLVLIASGKLPRPDAILFADVGNEETETYKYLNTVARPYAGEHGLDIISLGAEWRGPQYAVDLETYCLRHKMLPGKWVRWCTVNYKIKALSRYHKRKMGASAVTPVVVWIGISTDESRRAVPSKDVREIKKYPLIELGLSRTDCVGVIRDAGLPVPPKSGCWFCPFKAQAHWHRMKREEPALFQRALRLEQNAAPHYLCMFGSLERIAAQERLPGFDEAMEAEAGCIAGVCMV